MIFEYFIEGQQRDILLITEWIVILLSLEFCLVFWRRIKNITRNELQSSEEKAFLYLFLGYAISYIFHVIGYYYVDISLKTGFRNLAYLIMMPALIGFIRIMEKNRTYIRKNLFTIIFAILFIIHIFITFFAFEVAIDYTLLYFPLFSIFCLLYLKALYTDVYKKKHLQNFKTAAIKLFMGFLFLALGEGAMFDEILRIFGAWILIVGNFERLAGFIFLFWFVRSLPSFSEYNWQTKINTLLLIHKDGLLIYNKDFREEGDETRASIIAGMLTSIKMMLQTVTEKKGLTVIEKEGKVVIINPSKFLIGIIICDEDLKSLRILLSKFVERIEEIYYKILEDWNGSMDIFKPINFIINEFFP
jgi:predicted regulator of Ras-like GTPase activity (Roadblock/LC7/MglB family)